jgi:tRNA-Thr(GGU) m(6)t(6)A37 methyltransferase TsaA
VGVTLTPVGVVRCGVSERKGMPSLGARARIELFPEFAPGLLKLEKNSHVWVLAWLHAAERDVLEVIPRGITEHTPENLHGVFAVRAPVRPNPVGMTATKIVRIEAGAIEVERLDFLDGTPVIDIKPYFVSRDLIFSARNRQVGRPSSREAMRESLLMQAVNFHGELCADLARAVRVVEHFRAEVLEMRDPEGVKVTAPLARGCLVDALMGMLRVSLGRGDLRLKSANRVVFEHGGGYHAYELLAGPREVLAASDEDLFRKLD